MSAEKWGKGVDNGVVVKELWFYVAEVPIVPLAHRIAKKFSLSTMDDRR
jgi:hypothetical protein